MATTKKNVKEAETIRTTDRVEVTIVKDCKNGWKKDQKVSMHPKTAEKLAKRGIVKTA